ncbi:hypothetical protein OROGR_005251 [Orobanche gracilis]
MSSQEILKIQILKIRDVARILFFKIRSSQEILKIRDDTFLEKRVARILFFKIRPSQEILKIRDGTPLEAEEILIYIKSPQNKSVWHFSNNLDVPTNVVQKKRVAPILFLKIRPSQEILKIRYDKLDVPSNVVQKKRVARIRFFKIRPSQEILKIRDGTPLEAEEILIYIKSPQNKSVCHFSSNLDVPTNVVQKKRVAPILFLKIRPSQEILKIRYGTPMETEEILTYIKKPSKQIVARILFFKIRPSQEILKIRDGTPLEAEEILIYIKSPQNKSVWHFSINLDVPTNVVQKKRVALILFLKIRPSQEILKIRYGTPMETEEILKYIKKPSKQIVARIIFFKVRPSQEILKICHGTPLETEEILTYIKSPQNRSVWHFSSNLDVLNNVVLKKRVARILFFKIRPSQKILKIRYGTALEAEEILTYIKSPQRNRKRVAHILFFKIRPSQEILKIRDGTPLKAEEILIYIKSPQNKSKKRVARILFFKIRPSQEILKIRDGTPLEEEEILIYIKSPQNKSNVPSNVVQKKRVARIIFFKVRPSQEILKICHGTPLETEEILTYIKSPQNRSVWHFSSNLDVLNNVVLKKRVARIRFFKIRPSQEILKIRDGTPLEAEEILIYIKSPQNKSVWHFSSNLDVPTNVVQKKRVAPILFLKIRPSQEILKIRYGTPMETEEILTYIKKPSKQIVARILFFKIRPSQEILKIRDGTPLEAEEILIYIKSPQNKSVWHFSSNLDVPTNVVQKKRVALILFLKIRPSQEILKIRYGTPMETEEILKYIKKPSKQIVQKKRVARIIFFKVRPSQEILKICHGTPLETEEILTYIKSPQNRSVWHFSSNLDVLNNVVLKKRVARILFFKIRPSQKILKIRYGTALEMPSQEILKIRDGTPLKAEEILIYIKSPQNKSVWHFSSNLDVPTNKRVARILFFKIRPSQEILKICHGTPLETEEILIYIKSPQNKSVWHFSSNLDVPTNVVKKKRVARILFFKIRPSEEILKIRYEYGRNFDIHKKPSKQIGLVLFYNLDVPSNVVLKKRVARILFFKIRPSQEILKIRYGTALEAEEILIYIKSPQRNRSSQEILKIHAISRNSKNSLCFPYGDGRIFDIHKKALKTNRFGTFQGKLDVPSNVVQKKRVARILFFKIRPSQEILKNCHGTLLETEEILIYIKSPQNKSVWHFSINLDVPTNVVQKKRVTRILFFKIRPSQEILKIRYGTHMETEEILTYIKKPSKQIGHLEKF